MNQETENANKVKITVTKTEPKIKRVDLLDGGLEGLKVKYEQLMIRNTIATQNKNGEESHRPVQVEIRNLFKDLKEHLLHLAGYHWGNNTALIMLLENCNVNYFMYEEKLGKFQIGGTMKIKGKYTIAINTPLIANEDYEESSQVKAIIIMLLREVKAFMSGEKGADSNQVARDYMAKKKGIIDVETEFDRMSPEDQKALTEEAYSYFKMDGVYLEGEGETEENELFPENSVAKVEPVKEEKPDEIKQPQKSKKVAQKKDAKEAPATVSENVPESTELDDDNTLVFDLNEE